MDDLIQAKEHSLSQQEIQALIDNATSGMKAPLDEVDTSETILEGMLRIIQRDMEQYPALKHYIPMLKEEERGLLGELSAYRDSHARVATTWWSLLIATDDSLASLALRARIDLDIVGNYADSSWLVWWEDLIYPWAIKHAESFDAALIEEQSKMLIEMATSGIEDKSVN